MLGAQIARAYAIKILVKNEMYVKFKILSVKYYVSKNVKSNIVFIG